MGFFFRFLNEGNGISSGSNFGINKIFHRFVEMDDEIVKFTKKSLNNADSNIFSFVNLMFKLNSTLSVINMIITNFASSSSSGVIRSRSSKTEETVKSLFLEEMSISGKFVE